MWRSEDMALFSIYSSPDTCFDLMCELGSLGTLQFQDQNEKLISSERPYFSQLKLIRDLLSRLSSIETHLKKHTDYDIAPYVSEISVKNIISATKTYMRGKNISEFILDWQKEVNKMWRTVDGFDKGVKGVMVKAERGQEYAGLLDALRNELHDGPQIYSQSYGNLNTSLGKSNIMKDQTNQNPNITSFNNSVQDLSTSNLIQLNYITGVVDNNKLEYLQKTVFRVSRGNVLTLYVNLKDVKGSNEEESLGNF